MSEPQPQRMVLQFPPDVRPLMDVVKIYSGETCVETIYVTANDTVKFTVHTPDGDFRYIVDNKAKTLTTESDKPFLV
jgi:hypothetical protein